MARRPANPPTSPEPEAPFDQRLERLEGLVRELEGGNLGLEDAIQRYEQGVSLLKGCHQTLERFRARVEELSQVDGSLRPFAGDPDSDGDEEDGEDAEGEGRGARR